MPRLFLIRHGEPVAAWGGADADPGLSEAGKAQAEAAAARLAELGPLAVVSSPMRRCQETAAPYARRVGKAPSIQRGVSEVATPPGIDDRRAWLAASFPWRNPEQMRRWDDLEPLVRDWREDVLRTVRAMGADTAIFSHFIAINVIAGAAMQKAETIVFQPGYASITEIELRDGELRVLKLGSGESVGEVR